jgi:hypothetical protein
MTTRITLGAALLAATLIPSPSTHAAVAVPLTGGDGPGCCIAATPRAIDLAICLDTSGSMSGLIDSAKEKLWAIVNELGRADPTPDLRVGLLTYGNDGHLPEDGWVRLDVPFTTDLDAVSAQLFSLTTNGGTEYVGRVVDYATSQLSWSTDSNALKIVVVAGNESADQDTTRLFRDVCAEAEADGFHVNSIYCGNAEDTFAPAWRDVAVLGSGYFATIDKDNGTLAVATPYDADLARLNTVLNATYIPFGATGVAGARNQVAQDSNAGSLNAAALADRAATKAGQLYKCAWDLVDACESQEVDVEDLSEDALPEIMKAMTMPARKIYVAKKKAERAAVQEKIEALSAKRSQYIAQVVAQDSLDDGRAFDKVLRDAVRSQALAIGFTFPVQETVQVEASIELQGPPAPLDSRRVRAQSVAVVLPKKDDC